MSNWILNGHHSLRPSNVAIVGGGGPSMWLLNGPDCLKSPLAPLVELRFPVLLYVTLLVGPGLAKQLSAETLLVNPPQLATASV